MKTKIQFLVSFALCWSLSAQADFEFHRGVRSLGMGGTGVAVTNDETSLLKNPNGLRRIRRKIVTFLDPELTYSFSAVDPLLNSSLLDAVDPQKTYEAMSDYLDEGKYFKGQIFPSFVMRNFGVGFLAKYENLALRESGGLFQYRVRNDLAVVAGFNSSVQGGRVKFGFNARGIQRTEYFGRRDPATESMELDDFALKGQAFAMDAGLTLSLPWRLLPTLSLVANDLGGTSFSEDSQQGGPASVPMTVDVGGAVFPILSKLVFATLTVDYIDVFSAQTSGDFMDKVRIGLEWNRYDTWFVRAGLLNQDWTAGLEYSNTYLQVQMATYSEKVGFSGFDVMEDRRWVLKFNLRR